MIRRAQSSLLSMVLLLLLSVPAGATQPTPGWSFIDRVDVDIVNVAVYVTDRRGNHITDLEADDFELYDDGRRVEITNFYSAAPPADAAPVAEPTEQKLLLMIYVDNFNLRPAHRAKVLRQLGPFLEEQLGPRDRVMLVDYTNSVRVVQPLTNDRQLLAEGVKKLGMAANNRWGAGADPLASRYRARDPVMKKEILDEYQHDESHGRNVTPEQDEARILQSTRALATTIRSFGVQNGHKAVLYISDGLPPRVRTSGTLEPLYDHVIRQANAAQVTLYMMDARGQDGSLEFADQEALIAMADATGGSSLLNTSQHRTSLERMEKDFDHFYSLGYASPHAGDGDYHRLQVKLRRSGLRVRHRFGYLSKPVTDMMADRVLSSLVLGHEDNPLGITFSHGEPEPRGKDDFTLPILVRIPTRKVTMVMGVGTMEARLRIFIAVQDKSGGLSEVQEISYPVSVTADQVSVEKGIGFHTTLAFRPGQYDVAAGVWDEISGEESVTRQKVLIGE
ncbi:MAG: VWA domain-containing protein [bacterium]|nr:VWA domain-containing protein [bacterium]